MHTKGVGFLLVLAEALAAQNVVHDPAATGRCEQGALVFRNVKAATHTATFSIIYSKSLSGVSE